MERTRPRLEGIRWRLVPGRKMGVCTDAEDDRRARTRSQHRALSTSFCRRRKSSSPHLAIRSITMQMYSEFRGACSSRSCLPASLNPRSWRNTLHTSTLTIVTTTPDQKISDQRPGRQRKVQHHHPVPTYTSASPTFSTGCPSTFTAFCNRFRPSVFGHLLDGTRITDNGRDLIEDLLSPIESAAENFRVKLPRCRTTRLRSS
jgi:hypothetical protein